MSKEKKPVEPIETILTGRPDDVISEVDTDVADQTPQQLKPVLTDDEIAEIKAKARKQLDDERKKAAKKSLLEQELERLRMEEGMVTGGAGDQMVNIRIDLYEGAQSIVVNMRPYWHGKTYTVPRHVANSLRETMWRCWDQERIRRGESLRELYAAGRKTVISAVRGVTHAPRTPDA